MLAEAVQAYQGIGLDLPEPRCLRAPYDSLDLVRQPVADGER